MSERFDVIVANPPYIASPDLRLLPREVACYDPWRALDGGRQGLAAHGAIAADLPRLLAPDGIFVTEVGAGQVDAVAGILKASGLVFGGIESDLSGTARCVIVRLG